MINGCLLIQKNLQLILGTHPIIEEAKQIAKEIEKDNKMNR
jgi:hypothetical protein